METRPAVLAFIDMMLNSKYADVGSFDELCRVVVGKNLDVLFSTQAGLAPLFPKFAALVQNSSNNLARWTTHLLNVTAGDSFDLRKSVRLAFSARDWPPPPAILGPNQLVYLVCETAHLAATRQLAEALQQADDLHLKVQIIEIDPARSMEGPISPILARLQAGTFIIECRGDVTDTLPVPEFAALMAAATIRDYYTAYLPSYVGPALDGVPAIDLTAGFDDVAATLAAAFAHLHIMAPKPAPTATTSDGSKQEPVRLLSSLAESIVNNGLVVCVGADLPERLSGELPSQSELAIQLLLEAGLIDPATAADTLRREPLVPNFWAGFLHRLVITSRSVSIRDWKKELARRIRNSIGLVPSLTGLAEMLLAIQKAPPEAGQRLVIVTTNVDLALEYAFIEAGLAFESWVLPPPVRIGGVQFSFSAVFEQRKVAGGVASVSDVIEETVAAATEKMKSDYQQDVAKGGMDFADYQRLRQRNKLIAKIYERAARAERERLASGVAASSPAARPGPALPLLIKLNGSCHDEGDFIASADEDRYVKAALPDPALTGITNAAMVMLGYGLADPSLMDFYASILRERFDVGSNAQRIALVDSASWPKDSVVASLLSLNPADPKFFFGFQVVDTSIKSGLDTIADSYANAISTTV